MQLYESLCFGRHVIGDQNGASLSNINLKFTSMLNLIHLMSWKSQQLVILGRRLGHQVHCAPSVV
jgi:hypothetical protein